MKVHILTSLTFLALFAPLWQANATTSVDGLKFKIMHYDQNFEKAKHSKVGSAIENTNAKIPFVNSQIESYLTKSLPNKIQDLHVFEATVTQLLVANYSDHTSLGGVKYFSLKDGRTCGISIKAIFKIIENGTVEIEDIELTPNMTNSRVAVVCANKEQIVGSSDLVLPEAIYSASAR